MNPGSEHGWTIATYAAHNEALRVAEEKFQTERDRRYTSERESAKAAIQLAELHAEQWRSSANEWRGAMSDRDRHYVPRSEFQDVKERVVRHDASGKGMRDVWGWIVGTIAAGILLINFIQGRSAPTPSPQPIIIQVPASNSAQKDSSTTTTNSVTQTK